MLINKVGIKIPIILISFTLLNFSSACKAQEKNTELINNITDQIWIHSFEEDENKIKAYRSKDYNFPPARGREGFEIRADGSFIFYKIAPTDGTQIEKGSWKISNKKIEVTFIGKNTKREKLLLELLNLENGLLKIKEIDK